MEKTNKPGRPTVITPEVVSILVTSFHDGLTVREACWQAGISHEAYYSRLREDEQFTDTMSKAQSMVSISAKRLVAHSIREGNLASAKWWLERHGNPKEEDYTPPENEQKLSPEDEEHVRQSMASLLEIARHREKIYGQKSETENI